MKIINKSKPVMVSGATGYIGGVLVKRLLSEGLTVHAPIRNPEDIEKVKYLKKAAEKLQGEIKFFKADLLKKGSYKDAMKGCELVYHTASPFMLNVTDARKELLEPALLGTSNILETVNDVETVKRVVLTSSVAAIYGDTVDITRSKNGIITEDNWNDTSSINHMPYSYSKTIAEKEAWNICDAQNRWDMVVLNPSFVFGPGLRVHNTSESYNTFKQLFNGKLKAGVPDFRVGVVDVREVADAHFQAGYNPEAKGRFILSAESTSFKEIADVLYDKYGDSYPFPKKIIPKPLVWLLAPLSGFKRKMISRNVGYPFFADNSKSINQLGIKYRPVKETIIDFFEQIN